MKIRKRISFILCLAVALFAGMVTAHAYAIMAAGGFKPTPTQVVSYKGFSSAINSAITNACSAWNGAGVGTLITRSGSTHSNTKFPIKNSANQITHSNMGKSEPIMDTRYTEVKKISGIAYNVEVDININTAYPWSTSGDPNAYDFQNSFTHELGHLLGLSDEYSNSGSTMYSITNLGETQKRTLSQDDKNGIGVIY